MELPQILCTVIHIEIQIRSSQKTTGELFQISYALPAHLRKRHRLIPFLFMSIHFNLPAVIYRRKPKRAVDLFVCRTEKGQSGTSPLELIQPLFYISSHMPPAAVLFPGRHPHDIRTDAVPPAVHHITGSKKCHTRQLISLISGIDLTFFRFFFKVIIDIFIRITKYLFPKFPMVHPAGSLPLVHAPQSRVTFH